MKLPERDSQEWDDLCDRCGKCCLFPGTYVACEHLDIPDRTCLAYRVRDEVRHCVDVSSMHSNDIVRKLPSTCAYVRTILQRPLIEPDHRLIATSARAVGHRREDIEAINYQKIK